MVFRQLEGEATSVRVLCLLRACLLPELVFIRSSLSEMFWKLLEGTCHIREYAVSSALSLACTSFRCVCRQKKKKIKMENLNFTS